MMRDAIPHHMRANLLHAGIREVHERCPGIYHVDVRPPGSEDWSRVTHVVWTPNHDYRLTNKLTGEAVMLSLASDQEQITLEPETNTEELPDDFDPVDKPEGYNQGDVECVDALIAALSEEEFRGACKAQALQYVWRERLKGGDQDLKKSIWWLRMAVGDDPRADR